ncbi:SMC-Scp complex subunit ScpB [Candidatus Woesearchaeota archaeon]|nr:SMC-Scp complex subunit ScpB [Candidatus Woesearchaeota archaeon]
MAAKTGDENKVEAILFSSGRKVSLDELRDLTGIHDTRHLTSSLASLKKRYDDEKSSLMLVEEAGTYKITVRESYMALVRKIVPNTELSKTVMETLATLAWKSPIHQADLVKIRTNKAYDHIKELEAMGFIVKERHGRTYLLKLTQKFFDYFDLEGKEDLDKLFADFEDLPDEPPEKQKTIDTFGHTERLGPLEVFEEPQGEEEKAADDDEEKGAAGERIVVRPLPKVVLEEEPDDGSDEGQDADEGGAQDVEDDGAPEERGPKGPDTFVEPRPEHAVADNEPEGKRPDDGEAEADVDRGAKDAEGTGGALDGAKGEGTDDDEPNPLLDEIENDLKEEEKREEKKNPDL